MEEALICVFPNGANYLLLVLICHWQLAMATNLSQELYRKSLWISSEQKTDVDSDALNDLI